MLTACNHRTKASWYLEWWNNRGTAAPLTESVPCTASGRCESLGRRVDEPDAVKPGLEPGRKLCDHVPLEPDQARLSTGSTSRQLYTIPVQLRCEVQNRCKHTYVHVCKLKQAEPPDTKHV